MGLSERRSKSLQEECRKLGSRSALDDFHTIKKTHRHYGNCVAFGPPQRKLMRTDATREALAEEHVEHDSFPSAQKPEWQNHFQSGSVWRRLVSFRRVSESSSRGKSQGLTLPRSILRAFRGGPTELCGFCGQVTEDRTKHTDNG